MEILVYVLKSATSGSTDKQGTTGQKVAILVDLPNQLDDWDTCTWVESCWYPRFDGVLGFGWEGREVENQTLPVLDLADGRMRKKDNVDGSCTLVQNIA